jgi:phosphoglycerate dehydrogenase-like enzyme
MSAFRVALSSDFRKADGAPAYPMFDLTPLTARADVEVGYVTPVDGAVPAAALADYDALILLSHKFTAASIPANGRLAAVARFGVGYDTVDVPALTAAGIPLIITPDGVRRPVAVAILKDQLTRQGAAGFNQRGAHMGVGLVGKTLGSIGIGNIGAEMFRLAKPFDMHFIAHDPYADAGVARELRIELVDLPALFARADILTVNCPYSPATHHLVNAERLAMMKPTAYFINTARGPIVDQKALTGVLTERRIAGAGLDVLEQEPPNADDPILKLDNVIFAPHALCWTDQCFAGNGAADVAGVLEIMQGRNPRGVVNREVLDMPQWTARLADYARRFSA